MASKLQNSLLAELKKRSYVLAYSVNAGGISLNGLPDVCIHLEGGFNLFAEIKEPGDRIRKIQDYRFDQLKKLGFYVTIIRTQQDINNLLYLIDTIRGTAHGQTVLQHLIQESS